MKAKYKQRKDGECFEIPVGVKYRIACCDCGLVHDVVFLIDDKCKLYMAAKRNNKSTAMRRKNIKTKDIIQEGV
jgi:hypothetical protein